VEYPARLYHPIETITSDDSDRSDKGISSADKSTGRRMRQMMKQVSIVTTTRATMNLILSFEGTASI
jgi:hypothetical protein